MSGSYTELHLFEEPVNAREREWLEERGVPTDSKGRVIAALPEPDRDPDRTLEEDVAVSIQDLMRRDVDPKLKSGRSRRRAKSAPTEQGSRRGRPARGLERRVRIHTMISARTRMIMEEQHISLAAVFDDCARELARAS